MEYRILEITLVPSDAAEGEPSSLETARQAPEGAFETGELFFTMRPVYPLVGRLERPWPVRVPARDFPVLLEPFYYNAATAWASLTTSLTFLALGFVFSQALTFSVIPSRSMEPTLQVGFDFRQQAYFARPLLAWFSCLGHFLSTTAYPARPELTLSARGRTQKPEVFRDTFPHPSPRYRFFFVRS